MTVSPLPSLPLFVLTEGKLDFGEELYSIVVDLLPGRICSGILVNFGWVRVGLSELQLTPAVQIQFGTL